MLTSDTTLTQVSRTQLPTPPGSFGGSPQPPSPPTSDSDSASDPPSPMFEEISPAEQIQLSPGESVHGMLDRSRFMLSIFMFGILAFNPFSSLVNKVGGAAMGDYDRAHGGRMLFWDGPG